MAVPLTSSLSYRMSFPALIGEYMRLKVSTKIVTSARYSDAVCLRQDGTPGVRRRSSQGCVRAVDWIWEDGKENPGCWDTNQVSCISYSVDQVADE